MKQTAQKSVLRFNLGTRAKIVVIKKLKTTREWYFTHLPGRPHWGDRFEFWLAGSYRRRNHPCQILWQSVLGFRSSDIPNFALLHRNSWSPLQQCKHYRATLWYIHTEFGMRLLYTRGAQCQTCFACFDNLCTNDNSQQVQKINNGDSQWPIRRHYYDHVTTRF